jgi:hypothetical protein
LLTPLFVCHVDLTPDFETDIVSGAGRFGTEVA